MGFTAAVLHGPRRQPLHASRGSRHRPTMPTDEEAALRDRLAKLTAEFRHAGREAVAWQLADYIMRGPMGFIRTDVIPLYSIVGM